MGGGAQFPSYQSQKPTDNNNNNSTQWQEPGEKQYLHGIVDMGRQETGDFINHEPI